MKRICALLLALLLIASMTATVSAKVVTYYDDWVLEKYREDSAWKIVSCSSLSENIEVISSYAGLPVTFIDEYSFMNMAGIKTLSIPYGCDGIGKYAFIDCSALETVSLPYGMTVLDEGAFSGTTSLNSINLENTRISYVSKYAFMNSGIQTITLPDSCNQIQEKAFLQCADLTAAYIPDSVGQIADNAFNGCENLVIYANHNAYAIQYAMNHNIPYEYLDAKQVTFVLGDADGDGDVTILDATKIQRVLADLDDDPDGMIALRADSDEDELDIMDATRIQRWLAEYEVQEKIGESVTRSFVPVTVPAQQPAGDVEPTDAVES